MILYPFQDVETGELVDILMESSKAVAPGRVIRRKGRKLRRLISNIQPPKIEGDRFINYQVACGTEEATGADYYDKRGRPVHTSRRRAANWAAKKTGEGIIDMVLDD